MFLKKILFLCTAETENQKGKEEQQNTDKKVKEKEKEKEKKEKNERKSISLKAQIEIEPTIPIIEVENKTKENLIFRVKDRATQTSIQLKGATLEEKQAWINSIQQAIIKISIELFRIDKIIELVEEKGGTLNVQHCFMLCKSYYLFIFF